MKTPKMLRCKYTGEVFLAVKEYAGDDKYVYRAISMGGYLSCVQHEDWNEFIYELEGIEEVTLDIL